MMFYLAQLMEIAYALLVILVHIVYLDFSESLSYVVLQYLCNIHYRY